MKKSESGRAAPRKLRSRQEARRRRGGRNDLARQFILNRWTKPPARPCKGREKRSHGRQQSGHSHRARRTGEWPLATPISRHGRCRRGPGHERGRAGVRNAHARRTARHGHGRMGGQGRAGRGCKQKSHDAEKPENPGHQPQPATPMLPPPARHYRVILARVRTSSSTLWRWSFTSPAAKASATQWLR